ncbi:MAG TPA: SRPBCC family protein [Methylocystis sp.]|jgi:hypothetical protein
MTFVLARRAFAAAALSLLSAGLVAGPALAHGPSRQKVVEKIEINAPAAKVWEIVGNFQDLSWHPGVAKTEGTGGNSADAKRKLTLKSGGVIEESLTKYDADGKSLSYKIDAVDVKVLPVNNYSSTISVKDEGGKSVVEWKGAFYRGFMNNDPPPELSDEAGVKAVSDVYKAGLAALKAKAEGK